MLSVKQAAEILGIAPKSVYVLIKRKKIAYHQYGGRNGTIRFSEDDLRDFLEASRVEPEKPVREQKPEPEVTPAPKLKPPKVPKYEHLGI